MVEGKVRATRGDHATRPNKVRGGSGRHGGAVAPAVRCASRAAGRRAAPLWWRAAAVPSAAGAANARTGRPVGGAANGRQRPPGGGGSCAMRRPGAGPPPTAVCWPQRHAFLAPSPRPRVSALGARSLLASGTAARASTCCFPPSPIDEAARLFLPCGSCLPLCVVMHLAPPSGLNSHPNRDRTASATVAHPPGSLQGHQRVLPGR